MAQFIQPSPEELNEDEEFIPLEDEEQTPEEQPAEPEEIHVVDNVAILYINNKNTFKDAEGNEFSTSGPWTAVLFKQDGKWLFLSNSWTVNE